MQRGANNSKALITLPPKLIMEFGGFYPKGEIMQKTALYVQSTFVECSLLKTSCPKKHVYVPFVNGNC